MKQINEFKGRKVRVVTIDNSVFYGVLTFFNYNDQVVHLNDYVAHLVDEKTGSIDYLNPDQRGEMIVLNKHSWVTLTVGEKKIKNG